MKVEMTMDEAFMLTLCINYTLATNDLDEHADDLRDLRDRLHAELTFDQEITMQGAANG